MPTELEQLDGGRKRAGPRRVVGPEDERWGAMSAPCAVNAPIATPNPSPRFVWAAGWPLVVCDAPLGCGVPERGADGEWPT